MEGPHGIKIVPATSGTQSMTELSHAQHAGLIRAFGSLEEEMDVLIIDTAAGISDMVVSFSVPLKMCWLWCVMNRLRSLMHMH